MTMNIRTYKKAIREMNIGDTFYYNCIAGSVAMADYTKECIKNGTIAPEIEELRKVIVPDAIDKFLSGEALCPQMTYTKLK